MRRPRPGVGSELFLVALILIGLAGTFGLVVSMHRKAAAVRPVNRTPALAAVVAVAPTPVEPAKPEAPPPPVVVQPPPPPPEDPTKPALARLKAQEAEQRRAAHVADRKAEALETARQVAVADAQRWRRREALVRGQVDRLDAKARDLEMEADSLAMERDALGRERDVAKAAVVKARARNGGYAVMPNKGANGTWQRPVMIECRDGQAILQPQGLSFSMVDLTGGLSGRSSPLVLAVGRELIRAHRAISPDGAPVVPYIYFVIRPDGIRPYYEARGCLEPLGIAFGYELVEQDWEVEFPDFDNLDTWDDSSSPRPRGASPSRGPAPVAGNRPGGYAGTGDGPGQVAGGYGFVWPTDRPGAGRGGNGSATGSSRGQRLPGSVDPRRDSGIPSGDGNANGTGDIDGPVGNPGNAAVGVADANGFVWPADRPGGARGGDGMWPTRPAGDASGGSGLSGDLARGSEPGRAAPGATGSMPPLEGLDGGTLSQKGSGAGGLGDFPPLPGQGPGRGLRGTAPAATGSGRGAGGLSGAQPGLIPLNPDGLPGLDSPDQSAGSTGPGGDSSPKLPRLPGNPPSGRRYDPSRLTGTTRAPGVSTPTSGDAAASGSGQPPAGPPGGSAGTQAGAGGAIGRNASRSGGAIGRNASRSGGAIGRNASRSGRAIGRNASRSGRAIGRNASRSAGGNWPERKPERGDSRQAP